MPPQLTLGVVLEVRLARQRAGDIGASGGRWVDWGNVGWVRGYSVSLAVWRWGSNRCFTG